MVPEDRHLSGLAPPSASSGGADRRRSRGRSTAVACLLTLAAFFLVGVVTLFDRDLVHTQAEMTHVQFGWPLNWVTQNQEIYSPPMPYRVSIGLNPTRFENNTAIHELPLLANVGLVLGPLVIGAWWFARRGARISPGHQ